MEQDQQVEGAGASTENQSQDAANTLAPAAAAPAAQESGGKRRKAAPPKPTVFVRYQTKDKHVIPFDILVRGMTIMGEFNRSEGIVFFSVPEELCEAFEMHHHFVAGNVIEVPADAKPAA